jgi:hypothetical protein
VFDVLVDHATEIAVPFAEVSRLLLDNPGHWLPGAASGAQRMEGELLTEVGFEVAHLRVDKKVSIEILNLVRSQSSVVLLVRWEAHGGAKLFPIFEGSLELTPIDDYRSRLFVSGEYQPPGGEIGRFGDGVLLHHVATATIRDFTERIAALVSNSTRSEDAIN